MKTTSLILVLGALFACNGERAVEDDTDDTDVIDDTGTDDTDPIPDYFDPVAVGVEITAGWDAQAGELVEFTYDGIDVFPPFLTLTFTNMDYFSASSVEEQNAHACEVYVAFEHVASDFTVQDYDTNQQYSPFNAWEGAAVFTEANFEADEPACLNWDPEVWPGGNPVATFSGMRVGIAFGPMTDYLTDAWSEESVEDYGDFMMTEFIAINHPKDGGGAEFIGYNWVTALLWQMDLETKMVTLEDSPDGKVLVGNSDFETGGYVSSHPYWYEDFPNLDMALLKDGI